MPDQQLLYTDQMPGRTLKTNGREYLFFSGTSYLGVSCNQQFRQHLLEGFSRYGTNYSSSRNSNLKLQVFEEAEAYLAAYTGADAALTMSSGYLAGQALVLTLQDTGHFMYAPDTHPALWRSMADVPGSGLSYEDWVERVCVEVPALPDKHIVIVCNSLDPLKAQDHPFNWINSLPAEKQITLIIDDSHGLGVTGIDGAGIFSQLAHVKHMSHFRLLIVGSLGKAFGIPAGVILGDHKTIEQLQKSPYFGGASPAIPAYLYAFLQSGSLFKEAREKLYANIAHFLKQLDHTDQFSYFNRYPVFFTRQKELYPYLLSHDILISSFRYPTPADEPVTRVVLNSLHTPEDLNRLTDIINKI